MASSKAATVAEYLKELPEERRAIVEAVRKLVLKHLPKGYEETMRYGMVVYEVPLARYPKTYNKQPLSYAGLAAQKNAYSLYLIGPDLDAKLSAQLHAAYKKAGIKLDMGRCCIRFKTMDGLLPEVLGKIIAALPVEQYIAAHEASRKK